MSILISLQFEADQTEREAAVFLLQQWWPPAYGRPAGGWVPDAQEEARSQAAGVRGELETWETEDWRTEGQQRKTRGVPEISSINPFTLIFLKTKKTYVGIL